MSRMTASGLEMFVGGSLTVVKMADRVRLRNGWTGTAHNWTENGIMVRLDRECCPRHSSGLLLLCVEAEDGDIAEVIPQKEGDG